MLRQSKGARRYNERITLTQAEVTRDAFGHPSFAAPVDVMDVYAYVRQMSASKTMATTAQMDAVGLEIELRNPNRAFNGIRYRGHEVHFAQPEDVDGRGRVLRIAGWYQVDDPKI